MDSLWSQFLGGKTPEQTGVELTGDLTPGQDLDLLQIKETKVQEPVLPGFDYHREVRTAEVRVIQEDEGQLKQRITQIQIELKKLAASSKELQVAFKEVTVEQTPVKAGKYHLNFFEWLFNVIRQARVKIDESKSWLTAVYQKRAKRQYWNMFKKHGTTFGLSSERVVATQTG
ncbi:hypothetical protein HYS29_01490 [Candidatus Microgenomates bacterium]|nr:hypothetical protein [Candidatus Microgenomates bacterium]